MQHLTLNDLCGLLIRCDEAIVNLYTMPNILKVFIVFLLSL